VTVRGNLVSVNSSIIKNALLADQGITRLPEYVLTKEIAEKKVTILFAENMKIEMPIYAIYTSEMNISPKIKSFVSFLKENI
jgi:DNA-binding transcriptional LysR family regulator